MNMAKRYRVRTLILLLVPSTLIAVAAAWHIAVSDSGNITRANYDRIELGQTTFEQVHDLLLSERMYIGVDGEWISFGEGDSPDSQFPPGCEIRIRNDDQGRVIKKSFYFPTAAEIFDRLVYRIKLALGRS